MHAVPDGAVLLQVLLGEMGQELTIHAGGQKAVGVLSELAAHVLPQPAVQLGRVHGVITGAQAQLSEFAKNPPALEAVRDAQVVSQGVVRQKQEQVAVHLQCTAENGVLRNLLASF